MVSKILLGVGIFSALFAVLIFSGKLPIGDTKNVPQGEVILWGTLPESDMNGIIQQFNPQAKTFRVTYKEVREDMFSQKLLEALANGNAPDLIIAPYQIILSQTSRLYPFPIASYGEKQYKDTYIDGAGIFFTPYGALALPVSVEPMVLFYNRTLLSKHGVVNPPSYWNEVSEMAPRLTVQNNKGQFVESAISLGAPNTPYAKDILMALVGQLGQVPVLTQYSPTGVQYMSVIADNPIEVGGQVSPLSESLRFFTLFADPTQKTYTWNQFMGNADDAFVSEKLAMYIGYSGELEDLRARNPRAAIEMTGLPQTKGYNTFSTGMRMYGIATLKSTKNANTALTVQSSFASGGIAPAIAGIVGGVPPFRSYTSSQGLSSVIASSLLVAHVWQDSFYVKSSEYTYTMISDVLNNRQGIADAVNAFVSRMQDLYTPLK